MHHQPMQCLVPAMVTGDGIAAISCLTGGRLISTSYLQMAGVRSYNSREVNFYNPAVNVSHNGYVLTKNR